MPTQGPTDLDLFLTDDEMEMLKACQSEQDWKDACVRIKAARGGRYPQEWFHRVIESGVANKIAARWGGSTDFTIISYPVSGETK